MNDLLSLSLQLLEGFGWTLAIFFLTLLFALPLGMPLAMGRISKHKWISKPHELI